MSTLSKNAALRTIQQNPRYKDCPIKLQKILSRGEYLRRKQQRRGLKGNVVITSLPDNWQSEAYMKAWIYILRLQFGRIKVRHVDNPAPSSTCDIQSLRASSEKLNALLRKYGQDHLQVLYV